MGFVKLLGAREDRARTVNDKRAQILVALLGDAPEGAALSGAEFPGCDTEPGGEVAA
jgi:hypothetical protein